MLEIRDVSTVIVIDKDKILIQKRSKITSGAGYWNFPGGSVEKGESLEAAASRELEEESGLKVLEKDLINIGFITRGKLHIHFFITKIFSGNVVLNKESDDYAWITLDQFKDYLFIGGGTLYPEVYAEIQKHI